MEKISFTFEGLLSAEHKMDFYESSRFQYSTSRLLMKLDNYRRYGEFPKQITYSNDSSILILPTRVGSYGLDIIAPAIAVAAPIFLSVPLEALLSFVIDRIFHSADDADIRAALQNNERLIDAFEQNIAGRDDTQSRTIQLLRDSIEAERELSVENRALYERLLGDADRRNILQNQRTELRKISEDDAAELVTMSAPLLKEIKVPLRKSARTVKVSTASNDNHSTILLCDRQMANSVDTQKIDRFTTTIDINIIQFNKENGWGKFENEDWEGRPSFSVPGNILDDIKGTILRFMRKDMVEVDCLFVRSAAGIPQRIIITDIREIDEI